jgi:hypothetical protein
MPRSDAGYPNKSTSSAPVAATRDSQRLEPWKIRGMCSRYVCASAAVRRMLRLYTVDAAQLQSTANGAWRIQAYSG